MQITSHQAGFELLRELLAEGREVTVRIEGRSMLPFFRSGARIRLHPIRPDDLQRGHVVLGQTDAGSFVIHRVRRIGAERIILQGDGNPVGTESIPRGRIYGAVACSPLHLLLGRLWMRLGSFRKYPLWLLKRCGL